MTRAIPVPDWKVIDRVPLPCRHHSTYVERGSGQTVRFCDVCRVTYQCVVRESTWQNAWVIEFAIAPVEPAIPPSAETFPGTGRRGRGGNLAPAGNRKGAA